VYKAEFKKSPEYKKLEQEMSDNIIEYNFFRFAGLEK
jgi:hypothetical protein